MRKIPPHSPQLSKDEGLKNIGHIMSIGNLILGVNSVTVSCLTHYCSLLQNVIVLLKNRDSYYNMRQFHYEMRQLLQNALFITNCDSTLIYLFKFTYKCFVRLAFHNSYERY